jgi:hypothetical protein
MRTKSIFIVWNFLHSMWMLSLFHGNACTKTFIFIQIFWVGSVLATPEYMIMVILHNWNLYRYTGIPSLLLILWSHLQTMNCIHTCNYIQLNADTSYAYDPLQELFSRMSLWFWLGNNCSQDNQKKSKFTKHTRCDPTYHTVKSNAQNCCCNLLIPMDQM